MSDIILPGTYCNVQFYITFFAFLCFQNEIVYYLCFTIDDIWFAVYFLFCCCRLWR